MMEKLAQAGGDGGCTPTPFYYSYHQYVPAEWAIQSPCFISTNICILWLHLFGSLSILIPYVLCALICSMSRTASSSCCKATLIRCTASPACWAASSSLCKHHQLTVQPHPPAEKTVRSFSNFSCALYTLSSSVCMVKCPASAARCTLEHTASFVHCSDLPHIVLVPALKSQLTMYCMHTFLHSVHCTASPARCPAFLPPSPALPARFRSTSTRSLLCSVLLLPTCSLCILPESSLHLVP